MPSYNVAMNILILLTTLSLGLSESIESRLPEDPGMIYTVGFQHEGVNIGLDWKNRQVVPERACRKASQTERPQCQQAAIRWLQAECSWYAGKDQLSQKQADMRSAVCEGARALSSYVGAKQLADR